MEDSKSCGNCGKQLTGNQKRFCSGACAGAYTSKERSGKIASLSDAVGEKLPEPMKPIRGCENCSKPLRGTQRYFCSKKCRVRGLQKRRARENPAASLAEKLPEPIIGDTMLRRGIDLPQAPIKTQAPAPIVVINQPPQFIPFGEGFIALDSIEMVTPRENGRVDISLKSQDFVEINKQWIPKAREYSFEGQDAIRLVEAYHTVRPMDRLIERLNKERDMALELGGKAEAALEQAKKRLDAKEEELSVMEIKLRETQEERDELRKQLDGAGAKFRNLLAELGGI